MEINYSEESVPKSDFKPGPLEEARHDRLIADELRYFLGNQRTALARSIAAWAWSETEIPYVSAHSLKTGTGRYQLVLHMLEAAPWDDHYIAYVQRSEMKRMRTEWFVDVGFCDFVDWTACATSFLRMCRRHGLNWPTSRQNPERHRLEIIRAIHYLSDWRWQSTRRLMGRFIDDLL